MFSFFFNDTATTEIYTLSLRDALPISRPGHREAALRRRRRQRPHARAVPDGGRHHLDGRRPPRRVRRRSRRVRARLRDRKSTRLNSSHANISYAVFCLKQKKSSPTPTF